ncbi:hypothetical protein GTP55_25645 [Duganella sp. FT109W]|uniref:HeH/LEM domain-containing protein n=1 Tax=Duganella margarita TaxID=2692170 RepID=A0ABW9WND2_9BURK|nr:hypothetical protein [Duganella margarita]MYN42732.1 hypothetical protein [Duganella margarita]
MITTIKVHSSHPASQGPYVIIERADFNPEVHEKYDDGTDDDAASGRLPTMAELLAARDQLLERERELNAERDRLAGQAAANEAEAQRLAAERNALTAPTAGATAPDYSNMSKDELQAALAAKGKNFPAAANKADLIALLTAA